MSLFKAIVLFIAFAAMGAAGIHFGWDPAESTVLSYPYLLAGCLFIACAGGIALIVLAKGGLVLIDMIMFPGDPGDPPPALYKLPEWYILEGCYSEALDEYQKIAKVHPRQVECWTGMLDVLVTSMGDLPTARKRAQTGLRKVRSPQKQQQLREYYLALTGEELKPALWG